MTQASPKGLTRVTIEQLLPFGMLVRLADGSQGLIREREIAWSRPARRNWHARYSIGEQLDAVQLIGVDEQHQRAELSLRLAERDPWDKVTSEWLGQLFDGIVVGVQSYGAFVELEPGIVGLLHESRLPAWARSISVTDRFWVGDHVRVAVERINNHRRQIALSLSRALIDRWPAHEPAQIASSTAVPASHAESILADPVVTVAIVPTDAPDTGWRILVIEDDDEQRRAVVAWLNDAGHTVFDTASAEAGLKILNCETIDLLFTDFGLPKMNGVELLDVVHKTWPNVRCTLITDWARASVNAADVNELRKRGVALVLKPLQPADLEALLLDHAFDEPDTVQLDEILITDGATPEQQLQPYSRSLPTRQALQRTLEQTRRDLQATKLILFALDSATRQVNVLAAAGGLPLADDALANLIYSPVRDVAEDQVVFRIDHAAHAEQRVRYLRPLLTFEAGAGVPLDVQVATRYALFAFRTKAQPFSELQLSQLQVTAGALAAVIERDEYLSRAADTQRQALLGQLSSALVHEMNHVLTSLNFTLPNMEHLLNSVVKAEPGSQRDQAEDLLYVTVGDLRRGIDRLTDTARMFGKLTGQSGTQVINLRETLHDVIELVRDLAERKHITIRLDLPSELPLLVVPGVQLQQILLNILINAVQQIDLARSPAGGTVTVHAAVDQTDDQQMMRITIEDDGPGIHRQLWERIFQLGFTTRHESGSGLGLYISRSLADALAIRIEVADSYRFWGTTFAVEVPLAVT